MRAAAAAYAALLVLRRGLGRSGYATAAAEIVARADYLDSEPTGYELAGPEASRFQQRKITRGPRKDQVAWYDTAASRFMPAGWEPGKGGQAAQPAAAKAKPKYSPEQVHAAIAKLLANPKLVLSEQGVKDMADAVASLPAAQVKQLRERLGAGKGGRKAEAVQAVVDRVKAQTAGRGKPSVFPEGVRSFSKEEADSLPVVAQHGKTIGALPDGLQRLVAQYSGSSSYVGINKALRGGSKLSDDQKKIVAGVDRAIESIGDLPAPTVCYRGISLGGDSLVAGAVIEDPAYCSATLNPSVALEYLGGGDETGKGMMLEIVARRGACLQQAPMTDYRDECELLMPRGSRFRVVGKKQVEYRHAGRAFAIETYQLEQL